MTFHSTRCTAPRRQGQERSFTSLIPAFVPRITTMRLVLLRDMTPWTTTTIQRTVTAMEPTLPELLSEPRTELQRKQRLLVYAFFRVPVRLNVRCHCWSRLDSVEPQL